MTAHALIRLAERAPGIDPTTALAQINRALDSGTAYGTATSASGGQVYEVRLSTGAIVFPMVRECATGRAIVTVLVEGMDLITPTGCILLQRRGLPPGVHQISAEEYHSDPCSQPSLSATIGKVLMTKSPKHAWAQSPRLNPNFEPKDSKTFDIGRAAHTLILGVGLGHMVYPESLLGKNGSVSTNAAKEWEAECRADGFTPVKQDEADKLLAMHAVMKDAIDDLGLVIDPQYSELTAIAEIDGVTCRAMIDNMPAKPYGRLGKIILDLKTTEDACPEACIKSSANYAYDFPMAHYTETLEAATGERRTMIHLFQEKTFPFEVGAIHLFNGAPDDVADWMHDAKGKTREARRIWRECTESGIWPGYPRKIATLGAPGWYRSKWENYGAAPRPDTSKPSAEALRMAREMQSPERKAG